MTANIFIPCFVDQLFPETAFNMIRVLRKAGCKTHYNPEQTCCGQPAFNAGHKKAAREVALKFLEEFSSNHFVVAPSASCVGMVRSYYTDLFKNSSRHNQCKQLQSNIYELSEFLVKVLKVEDLGASLPGKATYHDSCSALRECGIKAAPRKLLANVQGLELVEMNEVETCCGFGGTFAVKFESISVAMAEQKVTHALETGAEYLISTDHSCLLHLDGYIRNKNLKLRSLHIADVLASGW
ncbi:MAG: (Fe-S)-binding protein [Bacteroidia bacterium]